MVHNDELICLTRYCPNCGSEIFCRSDYEKHRVFYVSEDMRDPTESCPQCRFDLLSAPLDTLLLEPHSATHGTPPGGVWAGKKLTEAVFRSNPATFRTKAAAKQALKAVGTVLFDILARGEDVRWGGLGSFKFRQRKPRKGRNPRTGEELYISARRVITFTASKALRDKINP